MANDDWFRRTTWTENDRAEFFARLARSRTVHNKAEYLRIQAGYIESSEPRASLELLQKVLDEFPWPGQIAQTHLQIATCRLALGEPDLAVEHFRLALAQEARYPNVRTQAFLDFATFAIAHERRDLYDEIEGILFANQKWVMFPVDHYRFRAALAVVADSRGDVLAAAQHARVALAAAEKKESGLRYHPKVCLVRERDQVIQSRLIELARLG